ncbi:suppressor of tumorigenicity 14 protein homolog [Heterodontus francisci]|uniref:suppressor of tumorigenicity 14 protein homolog n=1 Tax=Heterodontus francisci TaxID=7792 RepID=UPI00355C0A05
MLVTLLSDENKRFKGFSATFRQIPKLKECGGTLSELAGNFSTPYYPAFYPPNINCMWTIKVPSHLKIRIQFEMIRMEEPGIRHGIVSKIIWRLMGRGFVEIIPEFTCGLRGRRYKSSSTRTSPTLTRDLLAITKPTTPITPARVNTPVVPVCVFPSPFAVMDGTTVGT